MIARQEGFWDVLKPAMLEFLSTEAAKDPGALTLDKYMLDLLERRSSPEGSTFDPSNGHRLTSLVLNDYQTLQWALGLTLLGYAVLAIHLEDNAA